MIRLLFTTILQEVKAKQPNWFSRANKKFFNDVSYRVLYGKKSGNPFLVRSTFAWTDMFDQPKKLHWRINPLKDDLTIGNLLDDIFENLPAVKRWLKEN